MQEREIVYQEVAVTDQLFDSAENDQSVPYHGLGKSREDDYLRRLRWVWLKVVAQAEAEAEGRLLWGVPTADRAAYIKRARRWLCVESQDLLDVCYLGGADRAGIDRMLARNRGRYGEDGTKGLVDFEEGDEVIGDAGEATEHATD